MKGKTRECKQTDKKKRSAERDGRRKKSRWPSLNSGWFSFLFFSHCFSVPTGVSLHPSTGLHFRYIWLGATGFTSTVPLFLAPLNSCVAFNIANVSSCIKTKSVIFLSLYFLNTFLHFFLPKLYLKIEKTTSYRSPNVFQNMTNSAFSNVAHPLLPFLDVRTSLLVQVSSEAEGELFHSWKKASEI